MEIFLFTTAFRPALRHTQPPTKLVPGVKRPGVKLTTHLYLSPRLRICGAIPEPTHKSSWRVLSNPRVNFRTLFEQGIVYIQRRRRWKKIIYFNLAWWKLQVRISSKISSAYFIFALNGNTCWSRAQITLCSLDSINKIGTLSFARVECWVCHCTRRQFACQLLTASTN